MGHNDWSIRRLLSDRTSPRFTAIHSILLWSSWKTLLFYQMPSRTQKQSTLPETINGPVIRGHAQHGHTLRRWHHDCHRWYNQPSPGQTSRRTGSSRKRKHQNQTKKSQRRTRHDWFLRHHMEKRTIKHSRSKGASIQRYPHPKHTQETQISFMCIIILQEICAKIRKPHTGTYGTNNATSKTVQTDGHPQVSIHGINRHSVHKHIFAFARPHEKILRTNGRIPILWGRESIPKRWWRQRASSSLYIPYIHQDGTTLQHNQEGSTSLIIHSQVNGFFLAIRRQDHDSGRCQSNSIPQNVQRQRRNPTPILTGIVQLQCRNHTRSRNRKRSSRCVKQTPQGHRRHLIRQRQSSHFVRKGHHRLAGKTIHT